MGFRNRSYNPSIVGLATGFAGLEQGLGLDVVPSISLNRRRHFGRADGTLDDMAGAVPDGNLGEMANSVPGETPPTAWAIPPEPARRWTSSTRSRPR